MKNAPKVFVDANVWFSAFYGSPNCEQIIQAFIGKQIRIATSQQVITEAVRNLREKAPQVLPYLVELIRVSLPKVIIDPEIIDKRLTKYVHADDLPNFSSAAVGKVAYFVTGNSSHFSKIVRKKLTGIEVVTPKELVTRLHLGK